MEQQGDYEINAPRETVWDALNDPDVLGACITGCQEVVRVDETHFNAKVKAKIGPVSAVFQAALELQDLDPPNGYTIEGAVKGGAAGFAKGSAGVALSPYGADEAGTKLSYTVKANVGGKLAQVGSRLVDAAARKMADEFFTAFSERLNEDPTEATEADASEAESRAGEVATEGVAAKEAQPEYENQGRGVIWAIAFVVLALAIVLAI